MEIVKFWEEELHNSLETPIRKITKIKQITVQTFIYILVLQSKHMKHLFFILLLCTLTAARANEITYFSGSWAQVKAKAKAEHKYVMVDCYTDWCGWCKQMDKKTMPDAGVISMVNEKFIAVRMDMEHGEGVDLAMKYHVSAYPTFMFFNPAGEIVYMALGYREPKDFLPELSNAMDKNKQFSAPGIYATVNVGFPEIYKQAFAENGKRKFPKDSEVVAYLDKQKNLFSEVNWGIIARFNAGEKYTQFFLTNIDKYRKLYGSYYVDEKVFSVLNSRMKAAIKNSDKQAFSQVMEMTDKYLKNDADDLKQSFKMEFYKATKDWDNFGIVFDEYMAGKGAGEVAGINENCWNIYENCDDKKMLLKACAYMQKVVAAAPEYAYLDTYAWLLYKSGQMKEAEEMANKAIAAGTKSGDKTTSTEELLQKITGKK